MRLGVLVSKPFKESFRKLMNQPKVPIKTSFKLRGLAKLVQEELTKYEEVRDQIAKEYAVIDEITGKPVEEVVGTQMTTRLDLSKMPLFFKKIKELDSIEVKIDKFSISDLGEEKDLTLTPEDFFNLEFLVE